MRERKMIVQCGAVLGHVPMITRCEVLGLCLLQSKLETDRFWTKYLVPSSRALLNRSKNVATASPKAAVQLE